MNNIFHYTDTNGLLGIINNNTFRATKSNFLNDISELHYGYNYIIEHLNDEKYKSLKHIDLITFAVDGILKTLLDTGIYITSFSYENDSIELWNYYSNRGGYCLEFDTTLFKNQIQKSISYFNTIQILYDEKDQLQLFEKKLNEFSDYIDKQPENEKNRLSLSGGKRIDDILNSTEILNLLLLFKNPKFKYENEVRIVFLIRDDNKFSDFEIQFINKSGIITPYIEYKLNDNMSSLKSIRLGPLNNSETAEEGLKMLLIKKSYSYPEHYPQPIKNFVEILHSECPLRF